VTPANRFSEKISMNSRRLWKKKHPQLGHLDIELTERCDNNCVHCSINLPENDVAGQGTRAENR